MKTISHFRFRHVRRSQASAAFRRRASRSSASCRSRNGVLIESYAYDALGRRVATTAASGTERHVYDDNWQVIADLDANGNVLRSYVWDAGIDRLLAVKIGSRTYTAHTDVQGTVWAFSDEQGNVAAVFGYDAWGNVVSCTYAPGAEALAGVRYGFQGREHSRLTGFIHFRMRWYDPVTGRWLSKDPIRLEGGMNLYAFCACDPMNRMDAYGEIAILVPFFVPILYQVGVAAVQTLATVVVAADRIVSFLGRGGRIKGERNWASSRYK